MKTLKNLRSACLLSAIALTILSSTTHAMYNADGTPVVEGGDRVAAGITYAEFKKLQPIKLGRFLTSKGVARVEDLYFTAPVPKPAFTLPAGFGAPAPVVGAKTLDDHFADADVDGLNGGYVIGRVGTHMRVPHGSVIATDATHAAKDAAYGALVARAEAASVIDQERASLRTSEAALRAGTDQLVDLLADAQEVLLHDTCLSTFNVLKGNHGVNADGPAAFAQLKEMSAVELAGLLSQDDMRAALEGVLTVDGLGKTIRVLTAEAPAPVPTVPAAPALPAVV